MQIHKLVLLKSNVLRTSEGVRKHIAKRRLNAINCGVANLRIDILHSTQEGPTSFAFGDGVVGWIVGQLDDGSPTLHTLKFNC